MQSPPITVSELLEQNRRLREQHEQDIEALRANLRDLFAARALPAVLDIETTASGELGRTTFDLRGVASLTYDVADAMLVERAKRLGNGR